MDEPTDRDRATSVDWRAAAAAEYTMRRQTLVSRRQTIKARITRLTDDLAEVERDLAALDTAAEVFSLGTAPADSPHADEGAEPMRRPSSGERQFKEVAEDLLRAAYPRIFSTAEVQEAVERELGRKFHEKTAGMTLYRFSKHSVARRVAGRWQFIPEAERGSTSGEPMEVAS